MKLLKRRNPYAQDFYEISANFDRCLEFKSFDDQKSETIIVKLNKKNSIEKRLYYVDVLKRNNFSQMANYSQSNLLSQSIESLMEESLHSEKRKKETDQNFPSMNQMKSTTLWTDKYMPNAFRDLLSEEENNRNILCWLKSWDEIKFKAEYSLFHNNIHKQSAHPQETEGNFSKFQKDSQSKDFDLRNPLKVTQLQNKVILLAGPPGSGKTTVARVIARHCGYEPIEINASDDRNSERLIREVRNITETDTLNKSKKPSLLIIDEVDGATDSSNNAAVNEILDYIYKKETKAKPKDKDESDQRDENEEIPTSFKIGKRDLRIRRPIIFICNDLFSKGLRKLRTVSLVFKFKKAPRDRILERLKEICIQERFFVNPQLLSQICEINDDDIRSCLNMLEIASKVGRAEDFISNQINHNKDVDLNFLEILDYLFSKTKDNCRVAKKYPSLFLAEKRGKLILLISLISQLSGFLLRKFNGNDLNTGIFHNVYHGRSIERDLDKLCETLVFFITQDVILFSDKINNHILRNQFFELLPYTMVCVFIKLSSFYTKLNFNSTEKLKIEFPTALIKMKSLIKGKCEILNQLLENTPPTIREIINKNIFASEILSYIYQLVQPKIESVFPFYEVNSYKFRTRKSQIRCFYYEHLFN